MTLQTTDFSFYQKSFDCNPAEPFQAKLNMVHRYKDDSNRYMHRMRINLFYDVVTELIRKKEITTFRKALDIGCNAGSYSFLLSEFGFNEVRGIDIDAPLIERANQHYAFEKKQSPQSLSDFSSEDSAESMPQSPLRETMRGHQKLWFEVFNAEELNTNEQYDFILCTEVIEHTQHPEKVIANIKKMLAPGGIALITLPNAVSLPYLLTFLSYKIQGRKIHAELRDHLSYPFYRSKKLFKDSSLQLIKTTGTNLFYWHFMHHFPFFPLLNRGNFYLSKTILLKNFSQFYFMIFKNEEK